MKKTFLGLIVTLFFSLSIYGQTLIGNWKLTSLVIEGDMAYGITEPVTLNISENGKFSGNGGCNSFIGKYSFKNPKKPFKKLVKIRFREIIVTKLLCEKTLPTENALLRSLREADTISLETDELVIKSKAIFIKSPQGNVVIQNTMVFKVIYPIIQTDKLLNSLTNRTFAWRDKSFEIKG